MSNAKELLHDLDLLRHAVAANSDTPRKEWGYRNNFATGDDGPDREGLDRMVAMGFAVQGRSIIGGSIYFHVTPDGCRALGMTEREIKKACRL